MTYYQDIEPKHPKVGDLWVHKGETYRWDGKKWVKVEFDGSLDELYAYTDIIIGNLNRKNIGNFDQLKTLPKKLVITRVTEVYKEVDDYTKKYFLTLAKKIYKECARKFGFNDEDDITLMWLMAILEGYDPVTKYVYTHEVDRKRARTVEALMASDTPAKEVDTALKQWTRQVRQYADTVTDKAIEKVYIDNDIEEVMWQTEEDNKVCEECEELNGMVFPRDNVPPKPHYGCRCYLIPEVPYGETF